MCRACISTTTVCTDKMLAAVRVHTYSCIAYAHTYGGGLERIPSVACSSEGATILDHCRHVLFSSSPVVASYA